MAKPGPVGPGRVLTRSLGKLDELDADWVLTHPLDEGEKSDVRLGTGKDSYKSSLKRS